MHFDRKKLKKCQICGNTNFNSKSFSPNIEICSKKCLNDLFHICKNIKIKEKDLKKIINKPFCKTKKLIKKVAKKNKVSKKILLFEIETRKFNYTYER